MIEVSVIIPTCNKKETLKMALEALNRQSYPSEKFEVITVDDGSTDGTFLEIKKLIPKLRFSASIFSQKNQGPATARNVGIKKAIGKIILIINDDTIADSGLIETHLKFHKKKPQKEYALLGYLTWHPDLKITPFMYWLENGGPYFSFNLIRRKNVGWNRFWACNISLKKSFLEKFLFDQDFPYASWEDLELGYRLKNQGLKLFFDKNALGYHYHPTSIISCRTKMRNNGFSILILKKKIPRNCLQPLGRYSNLSIFLDNVVFNRLFAFILEKICIFFEDKVNFSLLYELLLLHYRIEGLRKFLQK